jgi:hypothetical protein
VTAKLRHSRHHNGSRAFLRFRSLTTLRSRSSLRRRFRPNPHLDQHLPPHQHRTREDDVSKDDKSRSQTNDHKELNDQTRTDRFRESNGDVTPVAPAEAAKRPSPGPGNGDSSKDNG